MKKRNFLVLGILFGAVILLVYPSFQPCEEFGGRGVVNSTTSCHCMGTLVTVLDEAPADGRTIRYCAGIVTERHCTTQRMGGPPASCQTPGGS